MTWKVETVMFLMVVPERDEQEDESPIACSLRHFLSCATARRRIAVVDSADLKLAAQNLNR